MTPIEVIAAIVALVVGLATALKPRWTFYALTYGEPERISQRGAKVLRFFAAWMALGAALMLAQVAVRGLGM